MKPYTIEFYYFEDLRATCKVTALNEIRALLTALTKKKMDSWCDDKGFRVEIHVG